MTTYSYVQLGIYFVVLLLLVKPLGLYMAKVYQGESTFLDRLIRPLEHLIYRLLGVNPDDEMDWKNYAISLLIFSAISFLVVYLLQRLQGLLPFNPQKLGAMTPDLAFNTAVSFATNTNWQNYGGETTLSYLTQMVGLTVQNFVSAAAGIAVLIAFIRSLARRQTTYLGNFWVDLTRGTLYILLPMSIVLALLLVSQGVVQTFSPYKQATLRQPITYQQQKLDASGNPVIDANGKPLMETNTQTTQLIAVGPAASQIAIKQLGTNGGGFFNANSAHPFENPTPFSNFLEMLSILLIPAALTYTFGMMVGSTRQGWAILSVMLILLWIPLGLSYASEQTGNPVFATLGVDQTASTTNPGGNMEGKEIRFGIANSSLWETITTAASNGSVNSMHDSYTPLGGLAAMWMMMLGEVSFGGVGSGLYGMLVFVIIAVFVAGLMVGRTPVYLGRRLKLTR
jgi:K+-transporting ATPase ATPase A chain